MEIQNGLTRFMNEETQEKVFKWARDVIKNDSVKYDVYHIDYTDWDEERFMVSGSIRDSELRGGVYKEGIVGVNFVICNTDEQALEQSLVPSQIQLGPGLTDGRGAGSQPEIGRGATLESLDEIAAAGCPGF